MRYIVCVLKPYLYAPLVILDFWIKSDTIIDVLFLANTDMENMDYSGDGIDCLKCLWKMGRQIQNESVSSFLCSFFQSPSSRAAAAAAAATVWNYWNIRPKALLTQSKDESAAKASPQATYTFKQEQKLEVQLCCCIIRFRVSMLFLTMCIIYSTGLCGELLFVKEHTLSLMYPSSWW